MTTYFKFDISAGNTVGRSGKPRTVYGEVKIDVDSNIPLHGLSSGFDGDQERLIRQMLERCAEDIRSRLERGFPLWKEPILAVPSTAVAPSPSNFLEEHVLEMLKLEPTWTLNMYAVYNDLSEEMTERLRTFLKDHLPPEQLR